jgi:hypothetical protein
LMLLQELLGELHPLRSHPSPLCVEGLGFRFYVRV